MTTAALFALRTGARRTSFSTRSMEAGKWLRPGLNLLADLAALSVASICARVLLTGHPGPLFSLSEVAQLTIPLALLCGVGLYGATVAHPVWELRKVTWAMALAALVLAATGTELAAGRAGIVIVSTFLLRVVSLTLARTALTSALAHSGCCLVPTIIVGAAPLSRQVFRVVEKHRRLGFKVVALLEEPSRDEQEGFRRVPLIEQLEAAVCFAKENEVSQIIVADADLSGSDLESIVDAYQGAFRRMLFVSTSSSLSGGLSVQVADLGGLSGLALTQHGPRHRRRLSKRIFDLVGAMSAGILLLPVLLLIYLALRLSTAGPALYGQRRIGRNGSYFTAWKFRSMVLDAESVLQEHLSKDPQLRDEWNRNHKLSKDPRVLPLGQFLRATSFDELPQLWNVIRGEMSLVGPRPIVEAEIEKYGQSFRYYQAVRPGVTGMWQVSGRSTTTYAERVRYDEYFVKNWSIWLDIYILSRTVKTVLLREGAC